MFRRPSATALLLLFSAAAAAADPVFSFDVPRESLADALRALGMQANINVLYDPPVVAGRVSPELKARLTSKEALARLLMDSGLEYEFVSERTVAIRPARNAKASALPPLSSADVSRSSRRGVHLADAGTQGEASQEAPVPSNEAETEEKQSGSLDQVIVTGSRLARPAGEGPVAVRTLTQEDIKRRGATSIAQALNSLPEASISMQDAANQGAGYGTTVRLRGMPLGTTLVLVNGRRVAPAGMNRGTGDYFNLDSIPVSAVERVEVVAQGASAIYGADALAGVVNIILKDDIEGLALSASYGATDDGATDATEASAAWGHSWTRGAISLVADYRKSSELHGTERALTSSLDYTRYGGPDLRVAGGNPANVYSTTTANLPGLSGTEAAIPAGASGAALTVSDFAATTGLVNKGYDYNATRSLIPSSDRVSAFLSGHYDIAERMSVFGELLVSRVRNDYSTPQLLASNLNVPATNPFNPFGVPVRVGTTYLFTGFGGESRYSEQETVFVRPLLGLKGQIFGDWNWQVSTWHSQDTDHVVTSQLNTTALNAALRSTDPRSAFNPFGGPGGSDELLASLRWYLEQRPKTTDDSADAFVRGTLFSLPAGTVDVALGTSYSESKLSFHSVASDPAFQATYETPAQNNSYSRETYAGYAEARVPLLNAATFAAIGESLTATLAVRSDHYSDFGTTTNPQFGLEWRPFSALLFRADYSRSFRAPTLQMLYAPQTVYSATVSDPRRHGETVTVPEIYGGNPELQPETGKSHSFGIVFSKPELRGLEVSLTQWSLSENGPISALGPTQSVNNESLLPGRVTRSEPTPADIAAGLPGAILSINDSNINFGDIRASGVDVSASLKFDTEIGSLSPLVGATSVYQYDASFTPGSPQVSVVGRQRLGAVGVFAPRWKGTVGLVWTRAPFEASLGSRYRSKYSNPDGYEFPSDWTFDLLAKCDLGEWLLSGNDSLRRTTISIGAVNITNRLPRYYNSPSNSTIAYDPGQGDIRGRYLYGSIEVKF